MLTDKQTFRRRYGGLPDSQIRRAVGISVTLLLYYINSVWCKYAFEIFEVGGVVIAKQGLPSKPHYWIVEAVTHRRDMKKNMSKVCQRCRLSQNDLEICIGSHPPCKKKPLTSQLVYDEQWRHNPMASVVQLQIKKPSWTEIQIRVFEL